MSDHDHDHDDQQCAQDQGGQQGQQGGGPNTDFLDFELHKVMYEEAESIVREAYRELLKDAAKRRLETRWGDRITALANLAVDEAMADADASSEIQALIEARNQARSQLDSRVQEIIRGESAAAESGDANADADADPNPDAD